MLLGAHCSTAGGVQQALERAGRIGAASCQIFVKNNMQWAARPIAPEECLAFRQSARRSGIAVLGHTGYLINLAGPAGPVRDKSIASLLQEMALAESLGLPFLVLHPGAHMGAGEDKGIAQVVEALDHVFEATSRAKVKIALENTAGQGTCLGSNLAHLGSILKGVKRKSRLCVCLDTAHLFAAGHDIRSAKGWRDVKRAAAKLFGLNKIAAFHLNDSKTQLGSRVDRHAHIGDGKIGIEGFRAIVRDEDFADTPACIETPKSEDLHEDICNLERLQSLCR